MVLKMLHKIFESIYLIWNKLPLQVKWLEDDGILEVYFYKKTEDGWHIYDTYHTIGVKDVVHKIEGPEYVQKSQTHWCYKFSASAL